MNLFYWCTARALRGLFRLLYTFKVQGLEHLTPGAAILAPNHTSFIDPPLIAAACPEEVHFLARAGLFHFSFFGWMIKQLNAHPIQGAGQDIQAFKIVSQLLSQNKKIVVFPEGERSPDGQLKPIKSGIALLAWRLNCPIIPIYLQGTFETWPIQNRWPKIGTHLTCIFGQPILPQTYANLSKKEAQQAITDALEKALRNLQQKR